MRAHLAWREGPNAGVYFDGFEFGGLDLAATAVKTPQAPWAN